MSVKITSDTSAVVVPRLAKRSIGMLVGLQICIFICALDQTVLNTAIPLLSAQLNGFDRAMWIVSSYLLFSTVATPVAGKLADMFGVRRVLIAATALFTLASALCGGAGLINSIVGLDAMNQLIAARCLQGAAGGAMIGLCLIAIGCFFTLQERGKLQGLLAASFVVAALIGPTVGGWLVDASSWRTIFNINIPLGTLACFLFRFCSSGAPENKLSERAGNIDFAGIATLILCVFPLMLASCQIGRLGRLDVASAALAGVALLMFCCFVYSQRVVKQPLIPPALFADRVICVALLTVFVSGIGLFGSMLIFALIMQKVMAVSAWQSGLFLTPLMLVVAGSSVASGFYIGKCGRYKNLLLVGLLALAAGSFLLCLVTVTSTCSPALLVGCASLGGIGLGLILPVHTIVMQSAVAADMVGVGTSMTQFFRSLGGTVGTAMMSALMIGIMKQSSLSQAAGEMFFIYGIIACGLLLANVLVPEVALQSRIKQSA